MPAPGKIVEEDAAQGEERLHELRRAVADRRGAPLLFHDEHGVEEIPERAAPHGLLREEAVSVERIDALALLEELYGEYDP